MSGLGLRGGIRMYRFTLFRFLYVDNAAAESSMGVDRQSRIFTVKFANVDGLQEILEESVVDQCTRPWTEWTWT